MTRLKVTAQLSVKPKASNNPEAEPVNLAHALNVAGCYSPLTTYHSLVLFEIAIRIQRRHAAGAG
jgi:hypothetical protein